MYTQRWGEDSSFPLQTSKRAEVLTDIPNLLAEAKMYENERMGSLKNKKILKVAGYIYNIQKSIAFP